MVSVFFEVEFPGNRIIRVNLVFGACYSEAEPGDISLSTSCFSISLRLCGLVNRVD